MKKNIIVLFFSGALLACDENEEVFGPFITSYPMSVGTEWVYVNHMIVEVYESETSDEIKDVFTYGSIVRVRVEKDTVLNDTMNVKKFVAAADFESGQSTQYKFIDSEGLKTYAYNGAGIVFARKKAAHVDLPDDMGFYALTGSEPLVSNGLTVESAPTLDVKLPLTPTSSWTYRHPTEDLPLQVDKKVAGLDTLTLSGENYTCYKISWTYRNDPRFEGTEITDWISEEGLIKRIMVSDVPASVNGEELYGKTTQTLTLKTVTIK